MKNVLGLALAATLASSTAFAGGMADPIMTMAPMDVMDESQGSSSGLIVPLILITLIGIALSQTDTPAPQNNFVGPGDF